MTQPGRRDFWGVRHPHANADGQFERHVPAPISVWYEARDTAGFAALKPVQGKVNLCEKAGDRYLFAPGPAGGR